MVSSSLTSSDKVPRYLFNEPLHDLLERLWIVGLFFCPDVPSRSQNEPTFLDVLRFGREAKAGDVLITPQRSGHLAMRDTCSRFLQRLHRLALAMRSVDHRSEFSGVDE